MSSPQILKGWQVPAKEIPPNTLHGVSAHSAWLEFFGHDKAQPPFPRVFSDLKVANEQVAAKAHPPAHNGTVIFGI
jgi:hypothetical protein